MNYKVIATRRFVEGIGIVAILYTAGKINKSLAPTPSSIKFAAVLVSAAVLSDLMVEYLGEKGYFNLGTSP